MSNKVIWDQVKQPPPSALKTIGGGRLKGMTDISPQWRYEVMTEVFGPIGVGWKYEVFQVWNEPVEATGEVLAFAKILLSYRNGSEWSAPIPAVGGSSMVAREKVGLYASDECYKMAITDALSVAMKLLGVGADIYAGRWDGSKYKESPKSAIVLAESSKSVSQTAWENTDAPMQEWLAMRASEVKQLMKEGLYHDAVGYITQQDMDPDLSVAFWHLFDSKERSALKKAKKEVDEVAAQALTPDALAFANEIDP